MIRRTDRADRPSRAAAVARAAAEPYRIVTAGRVGVLRSGNVEVKDGNLYSGWVWQKNDIAKFELDGNRIGGLIGRAEGEHHQNLAFLLRQAGRADGERGLGRYAEADAHEAAAVELRSTSHDYRLIVICVANRGRIRLARNQFADAWTFMDKALARTREIGERSEEASVLSGLGAAASGLGNHDTALELLAAGIALAREAGNADYTVRGTIKMVNALRRAGAVSDAVTTATDIVAQLRGSTARDHLAAALNALGAAHHASGNAAASQTAHREALQLARALEYRIEEARAPHGLGRLDAAQALYDEMGVADPLG